MPFTIGVPREAAPGETRVALTPDAAGRLVKKGAEVAVERGAGESAFASDAAYEAAGCRLVDRAAALGADLVATVQGPVGDDVQAIRRGAVVVGLLRPLDDPALAGQLAARGVTAIAMELVPRSTRAQRMDALSAMSTVSGYKAAVLAADLLPVFFPLLTTAAGTVRPARVLVLGAGVAGLQALATARRLGAITAGYDVRPAAREQVESVGARFVVLDLDTAGSEDAGGYAKALAADEQARQVELLAAHVATYDAVITTALIPGRPAPRLITQAGVEGMKPGSVIIDLAASNGGNCEATKPGDVVVHAGVRIAGPLNLPAQMPVHASQLYSGTVVAMIEEFFKDDAFAVDMADDILVNAVVAHEGAVVNERVRSLLAPA
ncbi:MAG TPA: Re/Si-specific NAD(P)(+) transhydrogenase subunit alpha [Rhodothermales bacterium]|nr:Re/Si-specific NAD(P)(+) transhydrogenase subunit alpha [Rhodothermales bacterium]